MMKRIHCKVSRTSDGKIAIVTDIIGRDFSIVRDTTGKGHVMRATASRGTKVHMENGEWKADRVTKSPTDERRWLSKKPVWERT